MIIKYPVSGYIYVKIPDDLANQVDEDGEEDLTNAEYYAECEAEDIIRDLPDGIDVDYTTGRYEILRR